MEIENLRARQVVNAAIQVHKTLGPGLLESAYQMALEAELAESEVPFESQYDMPIKYKGRKIATAYRIDLFVDKCLIVELKSVDAINDVHVAQTLTYMKLSGSQLGLVLNFNVKLMKNGIRRLVL